MSDAVVYIAKCAEHGLHGERDECFVCSKPVEHVTYVRADLYLKVYSLRSGEAVENCVAQETQRLARENEILRRALEIIGRPGETYGLSDKLARSVALSALGELGPPT